jgi:hypothetical protein
VLPELKLPVLKELFIENRFARHYLPDKVDSDIPARLFI